MKKILLITNYFHFKSEKESNRYRELAMIISKENDIELEVITSRFYQRTKTFRDKLDELKKEVPYKVTFIDEIGYSKSISFKRLRTSHIFGKNVIKYLKTQKKPDVIYQVVPTLDVAKSVCKYANKNKIPLIIDIQDLWPEAFKMAFNIPILSDLVFLPIMSKANYIYSHADRICAVSKTYVDRALSVNKKCKYGEAVYIGINLNKFDENIKNNLFDWNDSKLRLAYCGSLDKSYDIKLVIDALSLVKNPPVFVVIGDGELKNEFESYAASKRVNAEFLGYVPYEKMCGIIASCDMVINPIIGSSVATIINKHGDYAASGLPVLNTQNSKEYIEIVDNYKMGLNSPSGNVEALAKNIDFLVNNELERKQMGRNARRCAEELFDRMSTYGKLVNVIKSCLE